jgi:hypothetical protein
LKASGPSALVPFEDPGLQGRLLRNCLRLIAWGNPAQANKLASKLTSAPKRMAVQVVGKAMSHPLMSTPRDMIFKSLGIQAA